MDDPRLAFHLKFGDEMSVGVAQAAREALGRTQPVTRIRATKARVERVASNRRVPLPDGTLLFRASAANEAALRDAPEGLVDPWLRCVTFLDGDRPLVQLHYYATHPQSFYGDGRMTWDVPGMARDQLEHESGVFQIYFTGCGGNIAMGKYNTGTREDRAALAGRLHAAMRQAAGAKPPAPGSVEVDTRALADESVTWHTQPLRFTPREDGDFRDEGLRAQLAPGREHSVRLKAAMCLAWKNRLREGHAPTASCLTLGFLKLVHLPGEPFVEFQLHAQAAAPQSFVCVAGYGECGVWYYGPDRIYTDQGGYEQTWSFTGPCQQKVEMLLGTLLKNQ